MHLNMIMRFLNDKLAGENLMFDQALVYLDSVIDDINTELQATYPAFSEFNIKNFPKYPNYNFFPDKYIRSVVIPGAAYKFYTTDEEGASVAPQYMYDYKQNMFLMKRDYSSQIPQMFQDHSSSGMLLNGDEDCFRDQVQEQDIRSWFEI